MTADAMEGSREQCLAAGMDDYVAKPVKLNDLTAALRKWVPSKLPSSQLGAPDADARSELIRASATVENNPALE
jgi:DNA-binding response OmpR family regulator